MARPLDYPYHMTYKEIGDILGISWVRVRQLEKSGLEKLSHRFILRQYYLDHISEVSRKST